MTGVGANHEDSYDPDPRTTEDIFCTTDRKRFFSENEVAVYDGGDRKSFLC